MNYKGIKCPVCQKEFQQDDDIVVCPECGMPHHRTCYKEVGHCAVEEWHKEGKVWENPNAAAASPPPALICPNCGLSNPTGSRECEHCHTPLEQASAVQGTPTVPPQQNAGEQGNGYGYGYGPGPGGIPGQLGMEELFGAIHENDLIGDIPAKDFIFFVHQNYFYFLRIFKLMCQRAKARVFNWAAFFFNFFYFFYRKMYKIGTILLLITIVTNIPSLILSFQMIRQGLADPTLFTTFAFNLSGYEGLSFLSELFMYCRFGIGIFCGFTANRRYYLQAVEQIGQVRQTMKDVSGNDYYAALSVKGGTSVKAVVLLILGLFAASFLFSYFIAYYFAVNLIL